MQTYIQFRSTTTLNKCKGRLSPLSAKQGEVTDPYTLFLTAITKDYGIGFRYPSLVSMTFDCAENDAYQNSILL